MRKRRIKRYCADDSDDKRAGKGDPWSKFFGINKTLRRLHPADYYQPDCDKGSRKPEAEDEYECKTFADIPHGCRGKQNGQSGRARHDPAGNA